jgi:hypothetical protein
VRFVLFFAVVAATFSFADATTCSTKCNLAASDCMKACAGDPKDAQRPERASHLMQCLKTCEEQNRQCKAGCDKP